MVSVGHRSLGPHTTRSNSVVVVDVVFVVVVVVVVVIVIIVVNIVSTSALISELLGYIKPKGISLSCKELHLS